MNIIYLKCGMDNQNVKKIIAIELYDIDILFISKKRSLSTRSDRTHTYPKKGALSTKLRKDLWREG